MESLVCIIFNTFYYNNLLSNGIFKLINIENYFIVYSVKIYLNIQKLMVLFTKYTLSNPLARGGLFTDLSLYLYGGTSADLSKIPSFLGGIVIYFCR